MKRNVTITDAARATLAASTTGTYKGAATLALPAGQLDRKLYQEVADLIERTGGKWTTGAKAFLFAGKGADFSPVAAITALFDQHDEAGFLSHANLLDFFATPPAVAARMIELADFGTFSVEGSEPYTILEPSVGTGAIATAIMTSPFVPRGYVLDAVEIDEDRRDAFLRSLPSKSKLVDTDLWMATCDGFVVRFEWADFLKWESDGAGYDRILMNPPFTSPTDPNAYIAHIRKTYSLLAPGGVLVAVAPSGIRYATKNPVREFQQWALHDIDGEIEDLPEDSFKASGTSVRACLLTLRREA